MKITNQIAVCAAIIVTLGSANGALAGAVPGPKEKVQEVIRSQTTDVYRITFRAGETATVTVSGDGVTDLDVFIYDENGNLVSSDTDITDQCFCSWNPIWTGVFRIEVKNLGYRSNLYTLRTN